MLNLSSDYQKNVNFSQSCQNLSVVPSFPCGHTKNCRNVCWWAFA